MWQTECLVRASDVTLCYEYWTKIWRGAPKQPGPAGITPVDAVVGQFFYVVAHEFGHAMFDVLQVPSFGSAEDAADEFSTFMMLHLGKDDARRLISGAAYSYRNAVQDFGIICSPAGVLGYAQHARAAIFQPAVYRLWG